MTLPPQSETKDCITLASWLTMRGIVFCHIPNEGKRSGKTGNILKAMGLQPGFPDYLIFSQPDDFFEYNGVALEMKRKGGKLTKDQATWLDGLARLGWYTMVCHGAHEAIERLERLGY